jgi:signal peptidase II
MLLVASAVFVADAVSKLWAVYSLPYLRETRSFAGLELLFVLNRAPSFALGHVAAEQVFLVAAKFLILVWMGWRLTGWYRTVGLGLIVGGALGNLTSWAAGHAVVDFLVMPWATVNLADMAILIGSGIVGVGLLVGTARFLAGRFGAKADSASMAVEQP